MNFWLINHASFEPFSLLLNLLFFVAYILEQVLARWDPDEACRPVIDDAPVFYPTEEVCTFLALKQNYFKHLFRVDSSLMKNSTSGVSRYSRVYSKHTSKS